MVFIQEMQFDFLDTGRAPKAAFSFSYKNPICIHVLQHIPGLSSNDAAIVEDIHIYIFSEAAICKPRFHCRRSKITLE